MSEAGARPRGIRTKSAWLLVVPFFVFARPSSGSLAVGAAVSALGLWLRAWAAGTIRKDENLTVAGPYAHLRHPLYLGSMLIGLGLALASGQWIWLVAIAAYFALTYPPTVQDETARLTEIFGHRYVVYAKRVPGLVPRLRPYDVSRERGMGDLADQAGFAWERYLRHHEWEALLGALAAFAVLAIRLLFYART